MAVGTLANIWRQAGLSKGGALSTWIVVYERTAAGWSAYAPALPGVGAAGVTREETQRLAAEAIALHLQGLVEYGLPIPESAMVDVGQVEPALPT
jgi:predicted RNase H-like HicB family nuclease